MLYDPEELSGIIERRVLREIGRWRIKAATDIAFGDAGRAVADRAMRGWERINWGEALDLTAAALRRTTESYGPHAVALTLSSPSNTAIGDSAAYIQRLGNALGTPNSMIMLDVCGWGRAFATRYTYGVGSVGTGGAGGAMPHVANPADRSTGARGF